MRDSEVRDRDHAVTGWRYWQLSAPSGRGPSGPLGGRHLRSVTQKLVEWRPGHIVVAHCSGAGHRAPDPSCECGIYGARDLETLREHGLCLLPEVLVVGQVSLWGRVIDDRGPERPYEREARGWRAEFATPCQLQVVDDLVPGLDAADLAACLYAAYRVPAGTMLLADAVAGASATMLTHQAMSARASRTRSSDG